MRFRTLWLSFGAVVVLSFAVLGWTGVRIYQEAPPIPERVVTTDGQVIIGAGEISPARTSGSRWAAWRSARSGATAATSRPTGRPTGCTARSSSSSTTGRRASTAASYAQLDARAAGRAAASGSSELMRDATRYDPATGTLTIDPVRAQRLRGERRALRRRLRATGATEYAIPAGALTDPERLRAAGGLLLLDLVGGVDEPARRRRHLHAATGRTSRWSATGRPATPSSGPASASSCCSPASAAMVWWYAVADATRSRRRRCPDTDPLLGCGRHAVAAARRSSTSGSSAALILVQILLGVVTAHYGVEGDGFYGIPLAEVLPYTVDADLARAARHLLDRDRLAGRRAVHRPAGRRHGAAAASGSASTSCSARCWSSWSARWPGEWLSVQQQARRRRAGSSSATRATSTSTSAGSGRSLLLVGLFLWLCLMVARHLAGAAAAGRAAAAADAVPDRRPSRSPASTAPALGVRPAHQPGHRRVLALVGGPPLGRGLLRGVRHRRSSPSCSRGCGLVRAADRGAAQPCSSATIFLSGGIIGTLPPPLLLRHADGRRWRSGVGVQRARGRAAGASSASTRWENLRLSRATPWVRQYRWPIYFFVAVAFWNLVGAGLFGFMINPPIALYYMQGLNTTPVHGHAALFGVYGMLGIGLMLFCLRALMPGASVEGRAAAVRVLGDQRRPDGDGAAQPAAGRPDADLGVGRARLLVRPQPRVPADAASMQTLRWLRVLGDTIFAAGALALAGSSSVCAREARRGKSAFRVPDAMPERGRS